MRGEYGPTDALMAARLTAARDDDPDEFHHLLAVTLAEYDPAAIIGCLIDTLRAGFCYIGHGFDANLDLMIRTADRIYAETYPTTEGD